MVIFILFTAVSAWIAYRKLDWIHPYYVSLLLLPAMILLFFIATPKLATLWFQIPVWLLAFAVQYWILYQHEQYPKWYLKVLHAPTYLLFVWAVTLWLSIILVDGVFKQPLMNNLVYVLVPAAFLLLLQSKAVSTRWPCRTCHRRRSLCWFQWRGRPIRGRRTWLCPSRAAGRPWASAWGASTVERMSLSRPG